ncbi:MAG: PAS domain-containing protein [Chloroflexi bacterium]|nr:MAG: hypothetical protein CUN54_02165 [Phototrophicales bacterium]RMF79877.1 MAG: PAS domain-containing protein [Chloroflexota bacterium]
MANNPHPNAQEISGVLGRVNNLGTATERLFSRLYRGLSRRSELQNEIETIKKINRHRLMLKKKLEQREEEVERLGSILATISEGVIMQDMQGRIVLINNAAQELIGGKKNIWDTEIGQLFRQYAEVHTVESELTPLGEPNKIEVNNRIIGAQVAAIGDSHGKRLGTLIVLRDVTREALTERLKDQFVTAISHELRTPMTVIKHVSELITTQPGDTPPDRRFLEMLTRNVEVLDRMIVELLDISEMSAGSFTIAYKEVDIEDFIWNVVNGLTPELNEMNLDVTVMTRQTSNLRLIGDEQRLRWALGHLLQNAIRYTEKGGHIIVTASPTDDDHVAIQVVDTGVGINPQDLPHIFERFYRGKPRTSEGKLLDPRGLGQGLFVAQSVVEAHGGYLTVHSEEGQGSLFAMILPQRPPDAPE